MKFGLMVVISVGIMLLMGLAGVNGVGSKVLSLFIDSDNNPIQPDMQYNGSVGEDITSTASNIANGKFNFFTAILVGLLLIIAFGVLAGVQVFGSSINIDAYQIGKAALAYLAFSLFASDMWSLFTLAFSYEGWTWISSILFLIITGYLIQFAIACIEFVGGAD